MPDHTTTATAPPPCPRWCADTKGHPFTVESNPTEVPIRLHHGPTFGDHLRGEALEFQGNAHLEHQVVVVPSAAEDFDKPNQLLRLAGDAVNAAIWIQNQQAAPPSDDDPDGRTEMSAEEWVAMKRAFVDFIEERVDQALRAQIRRNR